jgi:hypothetical protein
LCHNTAIQGRNYTNVYVAAPDTEPDTGAGCQALGGTVFKNVTGVDNQAALGRCNDVFQFVATFSALRACGFRVSNLVDTAATQQQTWDGMIRVVCLRCGTIFIFQS